MLRTQFSPRHFSGLELWLDGADAASLTIATGVSQWSDKSGKGRNFSQSTANNQPATTTINNIPALSFDGVNDRLDTSSTIFTGTSSYSFFMVVEGTFPGTSAYLFLHQGAVGGADTNDFNAGWFAANGVAWSFGTLRTRTKSLRSGVSYNADQRFDSVNVSGAGLISSTGSWAATSATTTSYWNDAAAPSSSGTSDGATLVGMCIGCRYNATRDLFYTGKIGEIIMYSQSMSDAERRTVQRYLSRKWRLTLG